MKIVYKPQRIPFPFDNSVVWNDPVILCYEIPKSICDKDVFVDYQRPYLPFMLWKDRHVHNTSVPYISNITIEFGE